MKETTISIRGITPLLMHNGQLADPLNEHTKLLASLTKKRNKTDTDHEAVYRAEWFGSLYVDAKGEPCLPGEVIEAALVAGAKKLKLGNEAKGGIIVAEDAKLEYDGPRDPKKLWDGRAHKKICGVKLNGKTRVMRCRPMFAKWSCAFTVEWDPSLIKNESQLLEIVECAARVGVGDWRPKFGRFEIVS